MTISLSDLMKELQAGEEARAKVPALIADNTELGRRLDKAQAHSQELETAIIDYKRQIDSLSSRIRSLEVERDDAGFRELETADKLNTLLSTLRGVRHDIDDAVTHVDPPKPEPIASTPVPDASVPVTEEPGVSQNAGGAGPLPSGSSQPEHGAGQSTDTAQSGESAADPTTTTDVTAIPFTTSSAPSTAPTQPNVSGGAVEQSPPAPSPKTEEYRPFTPTVPSGDGTYSDDKRWYRKPSDMSTADWVASGGQR